MTPHAKIWLPVLMLLVGVAAGFLWFDEDAKRDARVHEADTTQEIASHERATDTNHPDEKRTQASADRREREASEPSTPPTRKRDDDRLMSPDFPQEYANREPAYPLDTEEPVFHPRDPEEWQGMKVDVTHTVHCSAPDSCPRGMACLNGTCEPCTRDSQCALEEVCSMDHCIPEQNVKCRSQVDCEGEQLCFLTAYGGGTRGTTDMKAYCAATEGAAPHTEDPPHFVGKPDSRPPEERGPVEALSARVRDHVKQPPKKPASSKEPSEGWNVP